MGLAIKFGESFEVLMIDRSLALTSLILIALL